ncbi:MAG: hypothetical protein ABSB24_07890 [Gaiellaceae bacterium]|jgi:hypothetical protein
MGRLNTLSLGRKLVFGAGVLLFIDTFFAWQKATASATANAWHGSWGVMLGLMTIAIVAWGAARVFGLPLPAAVPDGLATLALGTAIALFAVLKTATESYSAWPSYVGIVLSVVLAAGAWRVFQESGEALPREATAHSTGKEPPAKEEEPPGNSGGATPV